MIGIAFSLGFTVGPLLGAYFAISSNVADSVFYKKPALLAMAFSAADLLFIWLVLPETLTVNVQVSCETLYWVHCLAEVSSNKGVFGFTCWNPNTDKKQYNKTKPYIISKCSVNLTHPLE